MKKIFMIAIVLFLTACNSSESLNGTYVSVDNEKYTFTFKENKTVEFSNSSDSVKTSAYELTDKKINFQFEGGVPGEFAINKDGSLSLYGVEKYVKK